MEAYKQDGFLNMNIKKLEKLSPPHCCGGKAGLLQESDASAPQVPFLESSRYEMNI